MFGFGFPGFQGPGGGGFFGYGGGGTGRFEKEYNCFPASFLGRDDIDKGNKIILPASALEALARLNISYPMLFELQNERDFRKSHCGVLEFVAEEGTCYMPYWLMQHLLLAEGDVVKITNTSLPKGSYVKLQPVSKDFLDVHNPRAVLENSLRHFATLSKGDNIIINYNSKKFEIEIVDTKPSDAVSIIEADIEVDFAPPKDYVEPVKPVVAAKSTQPVVPASGSIPPESTDGTGTIPEGPVYFGGVGVRLDGKPVKNPLPPMPKGEHPLLKRFSSDKPQAVTMVNQSGTIEKKVQTVDDNSDTPWKKRIPGGIKREPPYGYLHLMEEHKRRQK